MPVDIFDQTGEAVARALAAAAANAATAILECLGREDLELCVLLASDARMRELNHQWRGKDSATDVLSFSQIDGLEAGAAPPAGAMLGDVVVSVETLRRQAADGGWTDGEELARLLLHGVLHLLGFDHERDEDAHIMRGEEGRIARLLATRGIACAWEEDAT